MENIPIISLISYLNAKPLTFYFENFKSNNYKIESDIPSISCNKLIEGNVEAGLVSSIIIAENPNLKIVDKISVSSEGPVESVLLFSKKPLRKLKTIALDPESRTSNVLLQILFKKYFNQEVKFTMEKGNIDQLMEKFDGVLAIGDKAFNYGIDNPTEILFDLAMEWKHYTGLPFVFAVWGVSKTSSLDSKIFLDAKNYGLNNINKIAENYAEKQKLSHFGRKLAYKYLTENLSYDLNDKEQKSLLLFYKYSAELKLIDYKNKIQFY